jgi:hypothetical protein
MPHEGGEAGFRWTGHLAFEALIKNLSPVIGERAVAVGTCFSRPRLRQRVPGC